MSIVKFRLGKKTVKKKENNGQLPMQSVEQTTSRNATTRNPRKPWIPVPNKMREKKVQSHKTLLAVWSFVTLLYSNGILACASYGQNASKWVLDQLFWVLLVGVIIAVAAMAVKRNFVGALTTSLVGAVVVYFVKNPTKLEEIGTSIMKTVGL